MSVQGAFQMKSASLKASVQYLSDISNGSIQFHFDLDIFFQFLSKINQVKYNFLNGTSFHSER
jgi:hypothetical protein